MAYTLLFVANFGQNNTGLTLNGQLYDDDGTPNGAAITTGIVEVDSTNAKGVYSYKHAAIPDDHRGSFVLYDTSSDMSVPFAVNPEEAASISAILADTGTDGVIVSEMKASALADFFSVASGQEYASAIDESVVKEIVDNTGGASLTEGGIAEAVWDQTMDGHTDPDTFGGQAGTDIDTILNRVVDLANDDIPGLIAALNDPTPGTIADAVWEENLSAHVSPTTFGGDVQLHTRLSELQSELSDLQAALTTVIDNLNDVSTTQVKEAVDDSLAEYDPATGSEVSNLPSSIPDGVWSYSGVRSLTYGTVQAQNEGEAQVTKYAGDTWDDVISNVSGLAGREDVYFVLKAKQTDDDEDALLLISENAGLLYWTGAEASDATKASITVDEGDETVAFDVDRSITIDAAPKTYYLGIKIIYEERAETVSAGYFTVYAAMVETNEVST